MASEFIFTMRNLERFYPPDREILKDVTLAFTRAKIGSSDTTAGKVIGVAIMAGLDDGFTEKLDSPGLFRWPLNKSPSLTIQKSFDNVMDGVAETQSLIDRYNEKMAMWGDSDADLEQVGRASRVRRSNSVFERGIWNAR